MNPLVWNGRDVTVNNGGSMPGSKSVFITATPEAARMLALSLSRLQQTTIPLMPEMEELLNALNFTLVGDPASRAAHRRMETAKGMTPDGGYRAPEGS
jgi:hypothetical protein